MFIDFTNACSNCRFNDGLVYTSNPPKYKCTFDNEFYAGYHTCHLDLTPVVRCEKCIWFLPVEKGRVDEEYKDFNWDFCVTLGFDGLCTNVERWQNNNGFCNDGETE